MMSNMHGTSSSTLHTYLTKLTQKNAVFAYRVCSFIKASPFELESNDSLSVRKFRSWWKLTLWHIGNWIVYFAVTFQLLTFIHTMTTGTSGGVFAVHAMYVMAALYGLLFMLSLYLKPDECIRMLCQHTNLLHKISDLGIKIPPWSSHAYVILSANYLMCAVGGAWLLLSVLFPVFPHFPCFLYSYIPTPYQNMGTFILCMCYETTWVALSFSTVGEFYFYWCADIFTMNSCLTALLRKRTWTEEDIRLYKYLQIFCSTFNDFNGTFFTVGFTLALVSLPVVFIYFTLTVSNLPIMVMILFPSVALVNLVTILVFLPQHSKVRILSRKLLRVMRQGSRTTKGVELTDVVTEGDTIRSVKLIRRKEMVAFSALGVQVWFFGVYTLQTSDVLMEQMCSNIVLLMSM